MCVTSDTSLSFFPGLTYFLVVALIHLVFVSVCVLMQPTWWTAASTRKAQSLVWSNEIKFSIIPVLCGSIFFCCPSIVNRTLVFVIGYVPANFLYPRPFSCQISTYLILLSLK